MTGPQIEVFPANTTIVGVRFHPGTLPTMSVTADDLVDQRLCLAEVWRGADRVAELMLRARNPGRALLVLQS